MSASYVREKVREWCESASSAEMIPFYYTINTRQDPSDIIWFTVQFNAIDHEGTFCQPGYVELGFFDLIFLAQPGNGDLPAVYAVEKIIPVMLNYIDPKKHLTVESFEPIQEYSRGDADSTYRVGVQMNYRYSL